MLTVETIGRIRREYFLKGTEIDELRRRIKALQAGADTRVRAGLRERPFLALGVAVAAGFILGRHAPHPGQRTVKDSEKGSDVRLISRARELGEARHERTAHLLLHGREPRLSRERGALRDGLREELAPRAERIEHTFAVEL